MDSNRIGEHARDVCDYHVARVLAAVLEQTQGKRLAEKDRQMWKMGFDVSDRRSIKPSFTVSRGPDGDIAGWQLSPGRLWFPRSRSAYGRLWEAMSDGMSYEDLLAMYDRDPLALETGMDTAVRVYAELVSQVAPYRALPPALLRAVAMPGWLSRLAADCNVGPAVPSCLAGVPAEDILA